MKPDSPFSSRPYSSPGFSLVEVVATTAVISTVLGVGLLAITRGKEVAEAHKLEADAATLNAAVRLYVANGGRFPSDSTAVDVLAALKTKIDSADSSSLVGLRGPFLDPRVTGLPARSDASMRVVWSNASHRFEIANAGAGFCAFAIDDSHPDQPLATASRTTSQKFAQRDSWVWDYDPRASASTPVVPMGLATSEPAVVPQQAQRQAQPTRLIPPEFSSPPGLYDYRRYPIELILRNPNPVGSSVLYYSLNEGPWRAYQDGQTLMMPRNALNSTVRTYAATIDTGRWTDSPGAESIYQTIFFRGSTRGSFARPEGDAGMVSNLTAGIELPHFAWGSAVPGQPSPNFLDFTGVDQFEVLPEEEFKLGELSYYNGTTYRGTNATSVQMGITLGLDVPRGTESLGFSLKLQSTPNSGVDADADADYVWIPTLSSQFSTTVQGKIFYLQLRFGNAGINGFTTIDEFHVHENLTSKGTIYGKLTTTPEF